MASGKRMRITRRRLLGGAAIAAGALAVGGWGLHTYHNLSGRRFDPARSRAVLDRVEPASVGADLPNIVLILTDDLGYADLTPYGATAIATPHLERLAREGVRLTQFYAAAPVCTPSRAALLTGRYPIRTHMTMPLYPTGSFMQHVLNAIGFYAYGVLGVPEDELLLGELLQRRGYRTALVGKWHLGDRSPHLPNENGFDFFYGALYSNDVQPYAIYRNRQVEVSAPADQSVLTQTHTHEAVRFIRENRDRPFFLYLAHPMVHEPIHASAGFRGRSRAGLYGDAVEELDWSVGQVLETLQAEGLDHKTLLVFTSDNGPWWQGSAGTLRGRKNHVFEGSFRVPCLVRWPGVIPAGGVCHGLAVNFDLFATCLKLAGIPLPGDRIIDGRDILPLLKGEAPSPHDTFYYYDGWGLAAVRHGKWKYHRRHLADNGGYPLQSQGPFLFDLEQDPAESYSLINSEPDVARALAQMLDDWEAQIRANVRGWLD